MRKHELVEPTGDDVVNAVLRDPSFQRAIGSSERALEIANAAVTAAFVYIELFAMVEEIQHEVAGHG